MAKSATIIDSREYLDWWKFAGLCKGCGSVNGYFECLNKTLSPAGVVTLTIHDYLEAIAAARGDIEIWLYYRKESKDSKQEIPRVERALKAIGADNLSAIVGQGFKAPKGHDPCFMAVYDLTVEGGTSRDFSIESESLHEKLRRLRYYIDSNRSARFHGVESAEDITSLLKAFMLAHQVELRADMDRIKDPRQAADFSRWHAKRAQKSDMVLRAMRSIQESPLPKNRQTLAELVGLLNGTIAKRRDKHGRDRESALVQWLKTELHSDRAPEGITDRVREWLNEANTVVAQYPDRFPELTKPKPVRPKPLLIKDPAICNRLDAIGPHTMERDQTDLTIEWKALPALNVDWCQFDLTFVIYDDSKRSLYPSDRLFSLWEAYLPKHASLIAEYRRQIIKSYGYISEYENEDSDYPPGLPERDIISLVSGSTVHLSEDWNENEAQLSVSFGIEFDQEHGLSLEFDSDLELLDDGEN